MEQTEQLNLQYEESRERVSRSNEENEVQFYNNYAYVCQLRERENLSQIEQELSVAQNNLAAAKGELAEVQKTLESEKDALQHAQGQLSDIDEKYQIKCSKYKVSKILILIKF